MIGINSLEVSIKEKEEEGIRGGKLDEKTSYGKDVNNGNGDGDTYD